jgi:hypothetical protein
MPEEIELVQPLLEIGSIQMYGLLEHEKGPHRKRLERTKMTGADILASYLEARRHGTAVKFHRPGSSMKLPATKIAAAPLFDFGHIDDDKSEEEWSMETRDSFSKDLMNPGSSINLPYEEIYYLFRYFATDTYDAYCKLLHLRVGDVGFSVKTWIMLYPSNKWALAPCETGAAGNTLFNIETKRFDPDVLEKFSASSQRDCVIAMFATTLLNRPEQIETSIGEIGVIAAKANERRNRVKLDSIRPPIIVRTNRYRTEKSGGGSGCGSSKRPHNRRGHWRMYKSGMKVWVRDHAIRGGSQKPRDYRVVNG